MHEELTSPFALEFWLALAAVIVVVVSFPLIPPLTILLLEIFRWHRRRAVVFKYTFQFAGLCIHECGGRAEAQREQRRQRRGAAEKALASRGVPVRRCYPSQ